MKNYTKIIHNGAKEYQYVVQNLTRSGLYLRITFPNYLLQKVLVLVPLKPTGPDVYTTSMIKFISDSHYYSEDKINYSKSPKINICLGENVKYYCAAILVDYESLESAREFISENLSYTNRIYEDTSDYIW